MVVKVVGREIYPGRRSGVKTTGMAEPERRGFNHERLNLGVVDGSDQGGLGVSGGGHSPAGVFQHLGHQRDHRRLTVGAGHCTPWSLVPGRG